MMEAMDDEVLGLESVRAMLDAIAHPVIITGAQDTVVYWNPAAVTAYGFTADEAIGQDPQLLLGEPNDPTLAEAGRYLASGRAWSGEMLSRTKGGEPRVMLVTLTPMLDQIGVIATAVDVTTAVADRRRLSEALVLVEQQSVQLRHQALHDSLTGLPNRVLVLDRAEQMLARARRDVSEVAALFVDVDNFKTVNDTFGHATGDQLLRSVAERLNTERRASDTLGRLGGDEFVLLTESIEIDDSVESLAERLLVAMRAPFTLTVDAARSVDQVVTVSVGIATGVRPDAESLLHDADIAMYRAKATGKNAYAVFSPEMAER
jgi:diguanylate cyclase (GGDEF)-like protein/PAS domain S-box-containing protein